MANVLVDKQYLQDIADAIRTKKQNEEKYKPGNMDDAILEITTDKPDQEKTVIPTTEQQIVTPDEGYELSRVIVEPGIDTSDADATENDILEPKTAYVNGQKVTGNIKIEYQTNEDAKVVEGNYDVTLSANYIEITPDNKYLISTNTRGDVVLTDINNGSNKIYPQSTLGIVSGTTDAGGVKGISICKTPNEYGAYMVAFFTRNNWSQSATINTTCVYYKDGELGYQHSSSQSKYYRYGLTSDWGRGAIVTSNKTPNIVTTLTAKHSQSRVVNLALSGTTSTVNLPLLDGDYSYLYAIAETSPDDNFMALDHWGDNNEKSMLVQINPSNFNFKRVVATFSTPMRSEFFDYNGSIYLFQANNLYKLVYNESTGNYTRTQIGKSNIFPSTYREMAHTQNNILTLDTDKMYRLYSYTIDDDNGLQVTLLKEIPTTKGFQFTAKFTAASNDTLFFVGEDNTVNSLQVLNPGEKVPVKIKMKSFDLINTMDADVTPNDMPMGKTAYVKGEKITGTVYELDNSETETTVTVIGQRSNGDVWARQTVNTDYFLRTTGSIVGTLPANELANEIGLTPDKLVKGNTVLNVEGTAESGVMTQEEYDDAIMKMQSLLSVSSTIELFNNGIFASPYEYKTKFLAGVEPTVNNVTNTINYTATGNDGYGSIAMAVFTPAIDFSLIDRIIIEGSVTASSGKYGAGLVRLASFESDTTEPYQTIAELANNFNVNNQYIVTSDVLSTINTGYLGFRIEAQAATTSPGVQITINKITLIMKGV